MNFRFITITLHKQAPDLYVVLSDGRACRYDARSKPWCPDWRRIHAVYVPIDRAGAIPEREDYAVMDFVPPPVFRTKDWRRDCFMQAKQDAFLGNLSKPEYSGLIAEGIHEALHSK